jgi:Holliday junction resolvase RusA-like endonuclease
MYKIISPLSVPVSKNKKFIMNLNNYRNAHYQTLNKAKINYKAMVSDQIQKLEKAEQVSIEYILFPETKRKTDIGNVISIHKKFFEDALTELGIIPDDNYKHVVINVEQFGKVDKGNGRVEIFVRKLK